MGQRVDGRFYGRFWGECAGRFRRCSVLDGHSGDAACVAEAIVFSDSLARSCSIEHTKFIEKNAILALTIIESDPLGTGGKCTSASVRNLREVKLHVNP